MASRGACRCHSNLTGNTVQQLPKILLAMENILPQQCQSVQQTFGFGSRFKFFFCRIRIQSSSIFVRRFFVKKEKFTLDRYFSFFTTNYSNIVRNLLFYMLAKLPGRVWIRHRIRRHTVGQLETVYEDISVKKGYEMFLELQSFFFCPFLSQPELAAASSVALFLGWPGGRSYMKLIEYNKFISSKYIVYNEIRS